MRFEEKKFCRISTLAERWDCSPRRIYLLLEKNVLEPFHPDGTPGRKGMMVDVQSVLRVEQRGMLAGKEGKDK